MQMKQCPNGHFYDQSTHSSCPYCTPELNNNFNVPGGTGAFDNPIGATMPVVDPGEMGKTVPFPQAKGEDDQRTVAFFEESIGINPVVGWLVCVEGEERGRDFRIHTENNFIGRSEKMDICIHGDQTISRENHAVLGFDSRNCVFYFSPGSGKTIIRVNDKAIFNTVELAAYDTIEIGTTKMVFVPYCKEGFDWN